MTTKKRIRILPPPIHFALGGEVGAPAIDPNGSDYDAINAEKTARWAADDAASKAKYGITVAAPVTVNPTSPINPAPNSLASMVTGTNWQQDMDARQGRINGLRDKLNGMEQAGRANSLMGSSMSISKGFADGGKPLDAEELMRQMTAKYGAPAAGPNTQPPAQQVQQPKPQAPAQQQPQGIVGLIRNRGVQIDKAVNGYAKGGKPRGIAMDAMRDRLGEGASEIKGPGTATSDSIPAVVGGTGEPIRVANGERIVSVAQDRFLEKFARANGFDSLDSMLEAGTGKPVGPTIKAGRKAAENGMPPAKYRPEVNGITWNDKGFDPTKEEMAQGTGAIAVKSGPNAGKNIAVGRQSYTAADGSQTSDWSRTAQYAQGMAQAQKERDTLATMQRDRLERDAYGSDITDPNVQSNARAQIAEQDAKAAKLGEAQGRMLDNQLKHTKLASEGSMAGLQAQYLAETNPTRRTQLAEQIKGVMGKGDGPVSLQHVETEKGTMIFDPRTGRMTPAVAQDGSPVGGGKALTEYQGKSTGFGMRADAASSTIDQVGHGGKVQPSLIKRAAESVPLIGEGLGMAANRFASGEQQQIEQAQRDFVNAVLRQESGAAISPSEFTNAQKQYFPQPNDTPEVVEQKRRNREAAINGFRISAGPGAKNFRGQQPKPQQPTGPKVGMVEGGHVYLGGDPSDQGSWKAVQK